MKPKVREYLDIQLSEIIGLLESWVDLSDAGVLVAAPNDVHYPVDVPPRMAMDEGQVMGDQVIHQLTERSRVVHDTLVELLDE